MTTECNICCEKYNKSINAKVTCEIGSCGFDACKTCIRTYLLGTTNDPHCMKCKNQWSHKFLVDNLNRSFIDNDYRKHRKNLLVDREISRTSELMNLVETTKLIEDETAELNVLQEEYKRVSTLFNDLKDKLARKRLRINRIRNGIDVDGEGGDGEGGDGCCSDRRKFIMPCPADECKGYLSSQYKCGICTKYTCHDCFEVIGYSKDEPHVCSQDNLKSAELIKKETKPCPQCGIRIFKISGCDQMWCTECKVAFSWNTGKIVVSGQIHNPHYYNYIRENGGAGGVGAPRNPGDILCGGLIPYYDFNRITRTVERFDHEYRSKIISSDKNIMEFMQSNNIHNLSGIVAIMNTLHRIVNHITNIDLVTCRNKVRDLVNFDQFTVQYILNRKTKEDLATTIFRNDNLRKKYSEMLNVYELLSVTGIERFNNISAQYNKGFDVVKFVSMIVEFIQEYNNLIKYCNKQLMIISATYNQSVSIIDIEHNYTQKSYKFKKTDIDDMEKHEKNAGKKTVSGKSKMRTGSGSGSGSSSSSSSGN